ncbi:cystathionine beta-lyase [Rhodomicrobium sp.]|uniref:cystathionine beta-lyase n=1 Tax=Rhodomicrobium sp. TaxID=2720632 RepID=UPI0039E2FA15
MTGQHGSDEDISVETEATQLGRDPHRYFGFVNMPVYRGSTVLYPNAESLESRDVPYTYGRPSNPTTRALEEALTKLEGGAQTFLAPSGLSAVSTLLLTYAEAGGHILITDSAYFPTRRFANKVLKRLGVEVEYYDPLIGGGIAALIRPNTKLVFTESPGSQTFEVQDIPAICAAARGRNVPVAIDNTWATPIFLRAFDLGVNITVTAATKYIVGHADSLLGAITCDAATAPAVAATHETLGLCVNGEDAFLALRGLRTLPVRLERHYKSALAMAEWLAARPEVARVIHPALPGCPGHDLWKRDFLGASGLFTIILKPQPKEAVRRFLNALRLFGMGYSWGGYESLIVPFDCSHSRTATKWQAEGPALRLHIGLEDVGDLKRDLERGFAALTG